MFSILKSNLVNPFEPMGETLKQELNETTYRALTKIKPDTLCIDLNQLVAIEIIAEEDSILCGAPWVDSVLEKIHLTGKVDWHVAEGSMLFAGDKVCTIYSKAKDILGTEKIILDFLCLLSSIAMWVHTYTKLLSDTSTLLYCDYLNIPGLSLSQQYAVHVGGGDRYCQFVDEEYLISKDYIQVVGGMSVALYQALCNYSIDFIKVEVTSFQELIEAIKLKIQHIKLCFFTLEQIEKAQELAKNQAILEVFGGVHLGNIKQIAQIGITKIIVDNFVSNGHISRYSLFYRDV